MHIVVLGAGFGGLTCALECADRLPHAQVTLVERRDTLVVGLTKLWLVDGRATLADIRHPLEPAPRPNLRLLRASVEAVDPERREVRTSAGPLAYDRLVVALGAQLAPPPEGARNLYAPDGCAAFHEDLRRVPQGGRALVVVQATPFKCPPAPYEAAALAKSFLRARGVEAEVVVASPEPHPVPAGGPECGAVIREWIEERGVVVRNGTKLASVDAARREARFEDGAVLAYDALAVVPPHRMPPVLQPLAGDAPWLPVDARTLRTRHPDVWAIGDCTLVKLANGNPLVKAGVMAEGEALVVARQLAGEEDAAFDGKGHCWLELGDGVASEVRGDFYATPNPVLVAKPPSRAALAEKERWVEERLARWLRAGAAP